ncbi:MAG: molybdopterin converting factor subunit 1 [Cycloclasticus sp.]|nr:molybdopterin converting factor subunit 1 [Cycloclasticus sp. 44_32_T64]
MPIKVLYFASLKEIFGRSEEQLSVEGLTTVGDVWKRVSAGHKISQQVLYSVNQEYAQADSIVKVGDEVAFFPPVTGG